ncbi:MAG: penicillin-binding protein 1C [Acidihalobacter sp.]|uniref:penicillin-binding protein 1C n=1 Tax=Acidihalobacter sp. TaxID=1872108 RepID=UPI00307DA264
MKHVRAAGKRWRRRLLGAAALPAALFAAFLLLDRLFPLPLPTGKDFAVVVTARDGTPLRGFADADGVWRYPVTPAQVSPRYLQALLGYEDRWFWEHPGINPFSLARAAAQWLRYGHAVSGGSTLTMQVARIVAPTPHTVRGKLVQMFRALQLERHLNKRQILTLYLDRAPFGGTLQGVQAASYAYLGKSAAHLSYAEAALLAVLPQAPSALRPNRHPQAARAARDKVLDRLRGYGVWSAAEVRRAKAETVAAWPLERPMLAPLLARRLKDQAQPGHALRTTVDAGLQAQLDALVRDYVLRLPPRTSAAALIVDNRTLAVRAYVGSPELTDAKRYGYVDMVRAVRSPGSTLKPFLYGFAIEDGLIHSASLLLDAPQNFDGYRPGDFSGRFAGPVTATAALQRSLNVPAVDLLDRLGPLDFAARLRRGGLRLDYPGGAGPNLSMILGGVGLSLENLVGSYTALARGGRAGRLRYTPDAPLRDYPMLQPGAAWIVRRMLTMPPPFAGAAESPDAATVAWKTGTSYGFRDAWAVGVTSAYTIGVWVGRPDGTPSPGQYGALTAAPLMFDAFALLPRGRGGLPPPPTDVAREAICWPLGQPPAPGAPYCRERHEAWIFRGMTPATLPDRSDDKWLGNPVTVRVDAHTGLRLPAGCRVGAKSRRETIALWPKAAQPWLTPALRRQSHLPALDPACRRDGAPMLTSLHILGLPANGTVSPAGKGGAQPTVTFSAEGGSGPIHWLVDGRQVAVTRGGTAHYTFAKAGRHRITAMDESGDFDSVQITATGKY